MKNQLLTARRRCAATVVGVLAAALLASAAVPLAAAAAPARTGTPSSVTFTTALVSVVRSSHVKLKTNVSDTSVPGVPASNSGNVTLESRHATEQHSWDFPTKPADLTVDSAGNGTLSMTDRMGSYGKVKLTLAHAGKPKTTSCEGDPTNYTVSQPVTATGTFYFDSKSSGKHRWGTVGSKSKSFTFPKATLVYTYGQGSGLCNFTLPCFNSVSFEASKSGLDLFGSKGARSTGFVSGDRSVKLSAPKGATRSDDVSGSAKMSFSKTGKNATLKLTGTGGTSGTATVSGKNGQTSTEPCGSGKTMKATFWSTNSYKPGKHPFTMSAQIFGALTITKTVRGTLSQYKS